MSDDIDDMSPKEFIIGLRGEVPEKCDFCGKKCALSELHPEEAGDWVCNECLEYWEKTGQ